MNSTATADSARIAVTLTEFHQTGSFRLSRKLSRPTHGWAFDTEKSYSTNSTHREKTSGKTESEQDQRDGRPHEQILEMAIGPGGDGSGPSPPGRRSVSDLYAGRHPLDD